MSTDREVTRIVRSWLDEGVTALPDRVLDAVLDQVPATRQRRAWWRAWRVRDMNNLTKLALTAAAVLVVAIVGYNLSPRTGGVGSGPTAMPTEPLPTLPAGLIPAGSYTVPTNTRVPYSVSLPTGWTLDSEGFITKGGALSGSGATGVALSTWLISHIYTDSCHWTGKLLATGTKDALASGLTAQTGHATSGPTEVTIGGLAATRLEFSLAASFSVATCDGGIVRLWPDPGPDESGGWQIFPGQTTTVYAMEAAGNPMVMLTIRTEGSSAADVAELQAILASVQFHG